MAKLIWAVPCNRILVDSPSNMMSYIDVLDGVMLPSFPATAPFTNVGTLWHRENEAKLEVRIRVYGVEGEALLDSDPATLVFEPRHKRGRIHIGFAGFKIEKPGRYAFGVELKTRGKWNEVHRIEFDIDQLIPSGPDGVVH